MAEKYSNIESFTAENLVKERYQRAQNLIQGLTGTRLTLNTTLYPVWIEKSDKFWYVRETRKGKEYRLVDANTMANEVAFDHQKLAEALSKSSSEDVNAGDLPIQSVKIEINPSKVSFTAYDRRWQFEDKTGKCELLTRAYDPSNEVMSPNKRYVVFSKGANLWLRDLEAETEKPLTHDGEDYYNYGANGTAWGFPLSTDLQVLWSPDSKKILTVQRDVRRVKKLPIVHHAPEGGGIRPVLESAPVAYPGDDELEELRLLTIDIETGSHQPADYRQIPVTRNSFGYFESNMGWWSKNSGKAWFVDVDRYYKWVKVVEFDTGTGSTRVVFEEVSDTHINLMLNQDDLPTFLPLPDSNEILWFSERTGTGHLYLYDLKTGELIRPVTSGDWIVRDIVRFDTQQREVFIQTSQREAGRDPYYRDLARVNIDTGKLTTLLSSNHECICITEKRDMVQLLGKAFQRHCEKEACGISPTGRFAVVTRSRADSAPETILINRDGDELSTIECADVSALPSGWQWPEPIELTAADGETKIYGVIYRPSDFSVNRSYPIISHCFNQPEISWVPKGSFTNDKMAGLVYLDAAALAELGFIVLQIDGRGSSMRSKSFYDESYGWFASAGHIDDHVAGIRQLAERYAYIDLDRVGVAAHLSGGSGAVEGMLEHPDFFKVGINSMFHDRRLMSAAMQGDKYEGPAPLTESHQYPEDRVYKLKGRLLLIGGMLDICTPVAATFRLIEALQKANKDFDMIILPNLGHAINSYLSRRTWDYLVKHLRGEKPPAEFKLSTFLG